MVGTENSRAFLSIGGRELRGWNPAGAKSYLGAHERIVIFQAAQEVIEQLLRGRTCFYSRVTICEFLRLI
jgi:hypothetical protein